MCGISGVELLVIVAAAIIFLGPDKLPELMTMAGRLAREAKRLRGELGEVTRELRGQVNVGDLAQDLGVDRVRERVKDAESEIDAIRRRLSEKVQLEGDAIPAKPGAEAGGGGAPAVEHAAELAAAPEATDEALPTIRPPEGVVQRGGDEAEAASPPPRRVKSTAQGAPTPAPEPETDGAEEPS